MVICFLFPSHKLVIAILSVQLSAITLLSSARWEKRFHDIRRVQLSAESGVLFLMRISILFYHKCPKYTLCNKVGTNKPLAIHLIIITKITYLMIACSVDANQF